MTVDYIKKIPSHDGTGKLLATTDDQILDGSLSDIYNQGSNSTGTSSIIVTIPFTKVP